MFTGVQLASLAGLWIIKDIKKTSILFPIMLVVMMGIRKLLDFVFTRNELKILDDILPEHKRTERLDDIEELEEEQKAVKFQDQDDQGRRAIFKLGFLYFLCIKLTKEKHPPLYIPPYCYMIRTIDNKN